MAEKEKKAKAPATPRKSAAKKNAVAEVTVINEPKIEQVKAVSHEEVARLAHRFWAERGHQHGNPAEDWFRAEQELRGKAS
jgi:hypothetical protein